MGPCYDRGTARWRTPVSDAQVVVAAVAASFAAVAPSPFVAAVGATLLGLGVASLDPRSRPWMVAVIVVVSVVVAGRAGGGATSPDGDDATPRTGLDGWATVVEDARPVGRAVRSVVVVADVRYEVFVRDRDLARSVSTWRVGSRVEVRGRTGPARVARSGASRRVDASLELIGVGTARPGAPVHRSADRVRDWVDGGAGRLGDRAGLFRGFVLGDRGLVEAATVDRFRRSGLSHLLVVSGDIAHDADV